MTVPSNEDLKDPNPGQNSNTTQSGVSEDDRAAALSKQQSAHDQPTQATGLPQEDDWASALAEQTTADQRSAQGAAAAAAQVFQPLMSQAAEGDSDIEMIMDIPVQLSVELGRTRLTIKNILQLGQGSVVELDGLAGEPMDIYVNGYLIAQGEVVVVDEKYGIRVTDIITPSDRITRLNNRR
jgi:flagellar motor switch protein FliN/FliY